MILKINQIGSGIGFVLLGSIEQAISSQICAINILVQIQIW